MALVYYRFEDSYCTDGDPHEERYEVIKETRKGVWVKRCGGSNKFIQHDWVKKFAYPTIEEARRAYIHRRQCQAIICLDRAKSALENLMRLGVRPNVGVQNAAKKIQRYFGFPVYPEEAGDFTWLMAQGGEGTDERVC